MNPLLFLIFELKFNRFVYLRKKYYIIRQYTLYSTFTDTYCITSEVCVCSVVEELCSTRMDFTKLLF